MPVLQQQSENVLIRNITLSLLSLCTMGIAWIAKEVVDLDQRVARIEVTTTDRSEQANRVEAEQDKHTVQLSDLNDRIIRLEIKGQIKH